MAEVKILIEGYIEEITRIRCRAGSTIILIQDGGKNILVDTGNAQDKTKLLKALKKEGLSPDKIDLVVNTHFHPDHVGCNYLFDKAKFIVWKAIFKGDIFDQAAGDLRLSENIQLIATPGHSEDSVSLLVQTDKGLVACVGDLFWREGDETIKLMTEDCSNKKLFFKNREKILRIADFIIPGHGPMYQVKK